MVKRSVLLIALVLPLVIAGCGKEGGKEVEVSPPEEPVEETEATETVAKLPSDPTFFESGGSTFGPLSASFSVEAEDAVSGVETIEVSVDGSDYKPYKRPIMFTEEGEHTIKYRATDYVGNKATEKTFSITIDDTPPSTEYRIEPEPNIAKEEWFVPPGCSISLAASDSLSGVQKTVYSVDGGDFKVYDKPIGMPGPGGHNFAFRSQDEVGTWEVETTITLIVDGKSPVTELRPSGPIYERDGENLAPVTHKYYLSATDEMAGTADIKYSIDGSPTVSYSKPIELKPGFHKITYYAIDRANNKENAKTFEVNVDAVSPEIKLIKKAE